MTPDADSGLVSKPGPNPRRVPGGRVNQLKRRGLSDAGRERLREAIRGAMPWRHSTGPRTAAGKARAALNGKATQVGLVSLRELKADLRALRGLLADMAAGRRAARV